MFRWGVEIACVAGWEQDTLLVKSKRPSREALRDLIALFSRYQIPMRQLAQFKNFSNEKWFAAADSYWYVAVFGGEPAPPSSVRRRKRSG
jgi:hypothetical protein